MKIGFVGAGRIGTNAARLLAAAGHEVFLSYTRSPASLAAAADAVGPDTPTGTAPEAVAFADVVFFAVPWGALHDAVEVAGPLDDRVVIDANNPFGPTGWVEPPQGLTSAQFNAKRIPDGRVVKAFNTLTAGFQAAAAGRVGPDRVVMFHACDDVGDTIAVAERLIDDAGFVPVRIGSLAESGPLEAPRRPGAVYGEEYHLGDALAYVRALREGGPLPGPSVT
jgi:8-hydroxy-5-deazaflavin:NADPH oxidoreductase